MATKKQLAEPVEAPKVVVEAVEKAPSIDGRGVKCDRVSPNSDAAKQLKHYASEPKVQTRIPRGAGEQPGAFETVIVNGLRINILKGVSVSLPESVAAIIDDSFYRTDQAINQTRIANPFTGASMPLAIDQQSETDKGNY